MQRFIVLIASGLLVAAPARAQRPIQWISNMNQGVAQARKTGRPIMFYITGKSGNSQQDDILEAQQNTFRDPLVVGIAQERFIPVRLALSTQTKEMLRKLGAPTETGKYLLFTTPNMVSLGTLQPNQVADKNALPRLMTNMFRNYRDKVFEESIKPKLEDPETKDADLIRLFNQIERMLIMKADASVIKLIDGGKLGKNTLKQAYGTLASLSTRSSVQALHKAAVHDKIAVIALNKCTTGGAESLLPMLNSENDEEFFVAYGAMVKICKLGKPKPKGFWYGKNDRLIDEELDRVEKGVRSAAGKWRAKYEPYR